MANTNLWFLPFAEEGFFTGCFGLTKHREMQFQLQRKLQQKNEFSREQKRKLQVSELDSCFL